jgi:hypothetical protein
VAIAQPEALEIDSWRHNAYAPWGYAVALDQEALECSGKSHNLRSTPINGALDSTFCPDDGGRSCAIETLVSPGAVKVDDLGKMTCSPSYDWTRSVESKVNVNDVNVAWHGSGNSEDAAGK